MGSLRGDAVATNILGMTKIISDDSLRRAHFKALAVGDNPARYMVARSIGDMLSAATDR